MRKGCSVILTETLESTKPVRISGRQKKVRGESKDDGNPHSTSTMACRLLSGQCDGGLSRSFLADPIFPARSSVTLR